MNTETGETYRFRDNGFLDVVQKSIDAGSDVELLTRQLERQAGPLPGDESRAMAAMFAGERVVAVSEHVAHAQRVGARELERRRRRRKAARQSRKTNR